MSTTTETPAADLAEAIEVYRSATEQAARVGEASDTASALRGRAAARVAELAGGQRQAAPLLGIDQSTLSKLVTKSRRNGTSGEQRLADAFRQLSENLATMNAVLADLAVKLETVRATDEPDFAEPEELTGREPEPEPKPR